MLRVLVIEDEVILGMLLSRILAGMGHEVVGVEGTEEGAVTASKRSRPDLILVDGRLQAGSGQAAMQRILADGFVPHVWMSGDPSHTMRVASGVAVLRKPFSDQSLAAAIAQVCQAAPPPAPFGGMPTTKIGE